MSLTDLYQVPVAARDSTSIAWVPCEERLPEDRRLVLLIATNAGPRRNYTTDHWVGWYNEQSAMWSRWPHSVPPTHWMPLPAGPRGFV